MLTLHAGPWVGEFGWELFGWQGFLRFMAQDYDVVKVYGPTGHRFLYEDFARYYVEWDCPEHEPNMWMNTNWHFELPAHDKGDLWIKPQQLTLMPNAPQQKFIEYGTTGEAAYDVVFHARNIDKYGSDYINFPIERWPEIIRAFPHLRMASIGSTNGAYYIPGTDDRRGIELKDLSDLLKNSKLLVGPSSGPMHFGALCGVPSVVWSGYSRSSMRYLRDWNPFNVKVRMIATFGDPWGEKRAWQPDTSEIIEAMEEML